MSDTSDSVHLPSDAEVRLATEEILRGPREKVAPQEGLRLMEERAAGLKQKIAGWKRILEQNLTDETARRCLAADEADLRDAAAWLQAYRLQSQSRN